MKHRKLLQGLYAFVFASAMMAGTQAAWISGKAWISQHLLHQAWQRSRETGEAVKPWQWADTSTIAQLSIPIMDTSLIVLGDASGEALAFGPGLVAGDPLRAEFTTVAIGGHRDTHLAFLEQLIPGEVMQLETLDGKTHHYRLLDKQVIDTATQSLSISASTSGLVLITCFPFDAIQTGGPLRMVARAAAIEPDSMNASDSRQSGT